MAAHAAPKSAFERCGIGYESFAGEGLELCSWLGDHVAILVPPHECEGTEGAFRKILKALDRAYEFHMDAAGRRPTGERVRKDRMLVAAVPKTCGGAPSCAQAGRNGIELSHEALRELCKGVHESDVFEPLVFKELARTFWFYEPQLGKGLEGGYLSFMRWMAMDAVKVRHAAFKSRDARELKLATDELIDLYAEDPRFNWASVRSGRVPVNELGLGSDELAASLLLRLRRVHGLPFVANLWKEAGRLPAAKTPADAVDHLALAAGLAARANLGPLLRDAWRLPVSDAAMKRLAVLGPPPDEERYRRSGRKRP